MLVLAACTDTAPAPETPGAPATLAQPHVPDGRFDAYAVNCEPCRNYRLGYHSTPDSNRQPSLEWMVRKTDDPQWVAYAQEIETRWRQEQEAFGPNSVEALTIRDHLVRLYHSARRAAQVDAPRPSKVATVELLERMLKR